MIIKNYNQFREKIFSHGHFYWSANYKNIIVKYKQCCTGREEKDIIYGNRPGIRNRRNIYGFVRSKIDKAITKLINIIEND